MNVKSAGATIRFYRRPQCGLCGEIEGLLMSAARRYGVAVQQVNIDEDRAAWALYWDRIPVVEIEGGPTFFEPIDAAELQAAIQKAARTR